LIVVGTVLSWYLAIVHFNHDVAFTLFNIACHGIPYMAIVWLYGKKNNNNSTASWQKALYKKAGLPIFLAIPLALAFVEEGFWDVWIWNDHQQIFKLFSPLKGLLHSDWMQIIVPILILPQITHYVLDGFIWKVSKGHIPEMQ
jgi:hypothetical protein